MKNSLRWLIPLFAVFFAGCASLNRAPDLSRNLPFGIISIVSNSDIYWYGEGPLTAKAAANPEKTKISKADLLINDAEEILWNLFLRVFITAYEGKSRIVGSEAYASGEINRRLDNAGHVIASGYRYINYKDKQFAANLAQERGVQGGIYLTFDFAKKMASGIGKHGTFRAMVDLQVLIVDAEGKLVYRKTWSKVSEDKIPISFGVYNHNDLMGLFKVTIEDIYLEFIAVLDPDNVIFGPPPEGIIPETPEGIY
jgi:hypothetical protein